MSAAMRRRIGTWLAALITRRDFGTLVEGHLPGEDFAIVHARFLAAIRCADATNEGVGYG